MPSTSALGSFLVVLAGALEGLFSLGVTRTPKWKWEVSWGLGSLIALVLVPWPLVFATIPDLSATFGQVPAGILWATFLFGVGWGLGGIFWGKAIACVGMALGVSLLMGLINVFGSLAPFAIYQRDQIATIGGFALMIAIAIMVFGIVCVAKAGKLKEADLAAIRVPSHSAPRTPFMMGLLFCFLSGILSALVNFSFIFGSAIAASAENAGAPVWAKGFAIWALVFTGNYLVNFLYALVLMIRNGSWRDIPRGDYRHWFWVAFMGIAWPAGIAIYGIAAFLLGPDGAYVGFPMMLVCSILFGNLAGAVTGEWKGASSGAIRWMACGVGILVIALAMMGWSNSLLAKTS